MQAFCDANRTGITARPRAVYEPFDGSMTSGVHPGGAGAASTAVGGGTMGGGAAAAVNHTAPGASMAGGPGIVVKYRFRFLIK